ncbi:hypothetical protein ABEB36_015530 [Hypothenemus hampei]|uniref:Secreted protein n=1 Tax=Hypothenemus hampei TaxID=57062 RepID=A0ABD1DZL4_HYPHA
MLWGTSLLFPSLGRLWAFYLFSCQRRCPMTCLPLVSRYTSSGHTLSTRPSNSLRFTVWSISSVLTSLVLTAQAPPPGWSLNCSIFHF